MRAILDYPCMNRWKNRSSGNRDTMKTLKSGASVPGGGRSFYELF
jgi:hypothetical protein